MSHTSWNDRRRARQRIAPLWKKLWPKFEKKLKKRMEQGHREYGDRSFDRPLFSLLDEIEEELLDQPVWAFIAWTRIENLRDRLQILEGQMSIEEMKQLIKDTQPSEEIPHIDSSE